MKKETEVKTGVGVGVLVAIGLVIWALTRRKTAEAATPSATAPSEGVPTAPVGQIVDIPVTAESELAIITQQAQDRVTSCEEIINQREAELGRSLTENEITIIKKGLTDTQVIEAYLEPSGLITIDDYNFWAPSAGYSTLDERRAKAEEISAMIGVDVSPTMCYLLAAEYQRAADRIEAEARGIKVEEIDPDTGEVIGETLWQAALKHARAVDAAASMTLEQYWDKAYTPNWYTETDKLRAYSMLQAESRSPVPVTQEFRDWAKTDLGNYYITKAAKEGDVGAIVDFIAQFSDGTPENGVVIPAAKVVDAVQAAQVAAAPNTGADSQAAIIDAATGVPSSLARVKAALEAAGKPGTVGAAQWSMNFATALSQSGVQPGVSSIVEKAAQISPIAAWSPP